MAAREDLPMPGMAEGPSRQIKMHGAGKKLRKKGKAKMLRGHGLKSKYKRTGRK